MLDNVKGVIFDMDGTLVDSMWIWEKVDIDFLDKRGIKFPGDLRENIEHLSFTDVAKYFKTRFELNETIEAIMDEWNEMALYEYTHNVSLKPGAMELLIKLREQGVKIGLATSNSTTLLELTLKRGGIYEYFDVIATTCEVDRGKNHPDIYLHTAKKLSVPPNQCIVFEDILPAIMGAKAAGMKVIGVYDDYSKFQRAEIISACDLFIKDYTVFDIVSFDRQFNNY